MSKHEGRSGFGPDNAGGVAPDHDQAHRNTVLSLENTAKMFGVSRLALRYYEWRGLIERRQRFGADKVYSWADCERLALIIKCRQARLPLRDIITIVEAAEDNVPVEVCKVGQERCMTLVDRLERRRRVVDEALAELTHIYAVLSTRILNQGDAGPDQPTSN